MQRNPIAVARKLVADGDEVVDVIVEIEMALGERHHARIGPIGDVDVVRPHELLDRATQQGCVVTGHRRNNEQLRLRTAQPGRGALEMDELTERTLPDYILGDGDLLALDHRLGQSKGRFAVAPRHALEQFGGGGQIASEIRVAQRIERVLEGERGCVGDGSSGRERHVHPLVDLVGVAVHKTRLLPNS